MSSETQPLAVVTGSSGGIGSAICRAFRANGYYIVGIDKIGQEENCDQSVICDLNRFASDKSYRQQCLQSLKIAMKNYPVRALINNAAVQRLGNLEEITSSDWEETLNVNLTAPMQLSQAMIPELSESAGVIINIASIHANLTKPGFVSYATSKAALVGLTKSMAIDLGGRVRVNAIAPSAIATPMLEAGYHGQEQHRQLLNKVHPSGRIGRPEEVAETALFLASDKARFINGATLEIDGGIACRLHDPL
jgi:NAD(P)-dependent dehydrogenase (short-subunit alcohol dehydrogenase family)